LPTLGLIIVNYCLWLWLVLWSDGLPAFAWIVLFALSITLFMSITHEVAHKHPTRSPWINRLLILFPLGWVFPYERFRDTHIQHHQTDELTDPFDDPESWYYTSSSFQAMNRLFRAVLTFNNTLLGRMLIGPIISLSRFYAQEAQQIVTNKRLRKYLLGVWILHLILCLCIVLFLIYYSQIPVSWFVAGSYLGLSVLLIRTYLEHQAVENHGERTVIIEKCCPLAFLFLFNNLHAVHHKHPGIPWYKLPETYRLQRREFIDLNNHYVYASYGEIFRKYFLTPKERIAHPFLGNRH